MLDIFLNSLFFSKGNAITRMLLKSQVKKNESTSKKQFTKHNEVFSSHPSNENSTYIVKIKYIWWMGRSARERRLVSRWGFVVKVYIFLTRHLDNN